MTTLTQLGIDSIADFTVGQDKIQLIESIFHIPTVGINNFIAVADDAAAATATAAIVYTVRSLILRERKELSLTGLEM